MKSTILALIGCAALAVGSSAQAPSGQPMSMQFTDTEVALVLKAVSYRTHSNIIYAGNDKTTVTVSATVGSAEEAVRAVASAAGLIYRKVRNVYIVATPANLRQATVAYGYPVDFSLEDLDPAKVLPLVQEAVPYATARTVGDKLVVIGSLEDIKDTRTVLDSLRKERLRLKPVTQTFEVAHLTGADGKRILRDLYPDVLLTSSNEAQPGGVFALNGPSDQVNAAAAVLAKLDVSNGRAGQNRIVYRVHRLRYTSAVVVAKMLKGLMPSVEAVIGLEAYQPPRAVFSPVTSQLSGGASGSASSSGSSTGSSSGSGNNSNSSSSGSGGASGTVAQDHAYQIGDRAMSIVLKGPETDVDAAEQLIRSMDLKPKQVILEAAVIETTPSFEENLGLNWDMGNTITIGEKNIGANAIGFGRFTRATPLTFTALLSASISKGLGKLIAHPRVQVTENDDADIFIGDTVRTKLAQANGLGGQTVSIQEFPIGIILLIRARTDPDGNVTMNLNPAVSTITSVSSDGVPQTATREAQTTVIVKDGETIVIGGLIREDATKTISEIPFLSRLPIVGELFRNRKTTNDKRNIIVTITPRIVVDPEAGK